jgi:hypothetical protein
MKLEWTVRFSVNPTWIEDGFNLTDEVAKEMLALQLPFAYGHELSAKVIDRPSIKIIKQLRGETV